MMVLKTRLFRGQDFLPVSRVLPPVQPTVTISIFVIIITLVVMIVLYILLICSSVYCYFLLDRHYLSV